MLAVLQWIYGPKAASDPYYLLLHDFVVLMPWWYPYMWLGIISAVVCWRVARRLRRRLHNRAGLKRVLQRTRRLESRGPARAERLPVPANDDLPGFPARRFAAE
jgi:hypothetical protein